MNRGEQAQQPDDASLLRLGKYGGQAGVCDVHAILHGGAKLKHAWQITSSCLKEIPAGHCRRNALSGQEFYRGEQRYLQDVYGFPKEREKVCGAGIHLWKIAMAYCFNLALAHENSVAVESKCHF